MKFNFKPSASSVMCAVAVVCSTVILAACGGGGGGAAALGDDTVVTTTPVSFSVIDGPIQGAQVFMDKNGNGLLDTGEVKGTTDATGKVTLDVPKADVGKYPIVAIVGAGAIDQDNPGVALTAAQVYTMKAPSDHSGVVSPLTTLVQHAVESDPTKATTTATAVQALKDQTGIANPMGNFVATASADPLARTVAKAVVAIKISKSAELSSAVNTKETVTSSTGTTISKEDIEALIRTEIARLLPAIVAAVQTQTQSGGNCASGMSTACQTAITTAVGTQATGGAAATGLIAQTTTTATNVAVTAGVVKAGKTPDATPPAATAEASVSLDDLRFSDLSNWSYRIFAVTAAQSSAVDANGMIKNNERRVKNVAGTQTTWTYHGDSARDGDLHWDGAAWKTCAESGGLTAKNPDAAGLYAYSYCGGFTVGKQSRTSIDISGRKFSDISDQIQAVNALWGTATTWQPIQTNPNAGQNTYPAGSVLRLQTATPSATAIAYDSRPAVGTAQNGQVLHYSAEVAAGGDAKTDMTHVCRGTEFAAGPAVAAATLEDLLRNKGVPCVFNPFTVTNPNVNAPESAKTRVGGKDGGTIAPTYSEVWGNSTLSIGTIGTAVTKNVSAFAAYTTNTYLRVGFGAGNAVTFYACRQHWNTGSQRECKSIGTGTYAITTLGDARVMSFSGLPAAATVSWNDYNSFNVGVVAISKSAPASSLTYDRVFVERGGKVYYGYKNKPVVSNSARLNLTATNAYFTAIGIPAIATPQ